MSPDAPAWVQRWMQTKDDEILYVDQSMLRPDGLTLEEHCQLVRAQEEERHATPLDDRWPDTRDDHADDL